LTDLADQLEAEPISLHEKTETFLLTNKGLEKLDVAKEINGDERSRKEADTNAKGKKNGDETSKAAHKNGDDSRSGFDGRDINKLVDHSK